MNEVRLLVESFERLDSAHSNFTQGVISYERLAQYRDAARAQIDAAEAILAARDAEVARLTAERDRYRDCLSWYAVAEAWEVDADGGARAFETLRDTGNFPAILAAAKEAKRAG
jgi:hypothetical protein